MEVSINKRLREFIKLNKIDEPETYRGIGTTRQNWNNWINADAAIPLQKVQRIIDLFPQINARWLLIGEGEMITATESIPKPYLQTDQPDVIEEPDRPCKSCEELRSFIKMQERLILMLEDKIEQLNGVKKGIDEA